MLNKQLLIIILILGISAAGYYIFSKNTAKDIPSQQVQPTVTLTPVPQIPNTPKEGFTLHSESLGHVEFEYPSTYRLSGKVETGYLSIMSPTDPDKPPKFTTVGDRELKIEIVTENSVDGDSSEKCFYDHTENPNVLAKSDITVGGVKGVLIQWEGLGTGEFVCLIKDDKRYLINKYPIETSRQDDYRHFISTWKFI